MAKLLSTNINGNLTINGTIDKIIVENTFEIPAASKPADESEFESIAAAIGEKTGITLSKIYTTVKKENDTTFKQILHVPGGIKTEDSAIFSSLTVNGKTNLNDDLTIKADKSLLLGEDFNVKEKINANNTTISNLKTALIKNTGDSSKTVTSINSEGNVTYTDINIKQTQVEELTNNLDSIRTNITSNETNLNTLKNNLNSTTGSANQTLTSISVDGIPTYNSIKIEEGQINGLPEKLSGIATDIANNKSSADNLKTNLSKSQGSSEKTITSIANDGTPTYENIVIEHSAVSDFETSVQGITANNVKNITTSNDGITTISKKLKVNENVEATGNISGANINNTALILDCNNNKSAVAAKILIRNINASGGTSICYNNSDTRYPYWYLALNDSGDGDAVRDLTREQIAAVDIKIRDLSYNPLLFWNSSDKKFDYAASDSIINAGGQIQAQSFYATSDIRKKENIQDFAPTKSILDLPLKRFDFIEGKKNQIGCIAQDLQKICPEIVEEGSDGYLSIQESKIVYLLLDEVKKLKAEVEELKKKMEE